MDGWLWPFNHPGVGGNGHGKDGDGHQRNDGSADQLHDSLLSTNKLHINVGLNRLGFAGAHDRQHPTPNNQRLLSEPVPPIEVWCGRRSGTPSVTGLQNIRAKSLDHRQTRGEGRPEFVYSPPVPSAVRPPIRRRRWGAIALLTSLVVLVLALAARAMPGARARGLPTAGAQWIWKDTDWDDHQPAAF